MSQNVNEMTGIRKRTGQLFLNGGSTSVLRQRGAAFSLGTYCFRRCLEKLIAIVTSAQDGMDGVLVVVANRTH
jgi:hypothetical protein